MSAIEANHSSFSDLDLTKYSVVEVNLGYKDRLQAILKPIGCFGKYLNSDGCTISITNLVQLLKDNPSNGEDTHVFCTSEQSGTFALFSSVCKIDCNYDLKWHGFKQFFENDSAQKLEMDLPGVKSIVLCADLYRPKDDVFTCKGCEGRLVDIVDKQGRRIEKSLYLYFVVNRDKPMIAPAIMSFLRLIGREDVASNIQQNNLVERAIYRDVAYQIK